MIIGSIIGAGLDFIGNRRNERSAQQHAAAQQASSQVFSDAQLQKSLDFQNRWNQIALNFQRDEQELREGLTRYGIQRRVKDAKAAGLHPLFALGGSIQSSPISFIPGQAPTGSGAGTAVASSAGRASDFASVGGAFDRRSRSKEERARAAEELAYNRARQKAIDDVNLRQAESKIRVDDAMAAYYQSRAAKATQEASAQGADGGALSTAAEVSSAKIPHQVVPTPIIRGSHRAMDSRGNPYNAYTEESGAGELAPVLTGLRYIGQTLKESRKRFVGSRQHRDFLRREQARVGRYWRRRRRMKRRQQ